MTSTRAALLAFSLALTPVAAVAQELAPVDSAFERIKVKIVQAQRTPPADRQPVYDELFALCGSFLDTHLRAASPEQVEKAGGFWLMLAERLRTPEQVIDQKLAALRALPSLPAKLEQVVSRMEAARAIRVGAVAPNFSAKDLRDGETVTLEGLRGKLVLLTFWGSASEQARTALRQTIVPLHRRYAKDARVVIVGVGVTWQGDTVEAQRQVADDDGFAWKLLFDEQDAATRAFRVTAIPLLVFLDEQGKILVIGGAFGEVDRILTQRLGPGEAPAETPAPTTPGG